VTAQIRTATTVVVPAMVGTLALVASVVLYFPGWLSFDSAFQYWQVRSGHYSNLSPVAMTALWALVHQAWPSTGAMLCLHLVLYWTGVVLLAQEFWTTAASRSFAILVAGLVPPVVVIFGHLWTDASLIATMTFAFALTIAGWRRRRRWPLLMALPVIGYAGAVRHNSLVAIVPLCLLWVHAWRAAAARRPDRPLLPRPWVALGGAALIVAFAFAGGRVLDRLLVEERVSTWAIGALWDLAAISLDTDTLLLPTPSLTPGTSLATLRATYTPLTVVPLFSGPGRVRNGLGAELFSPDELALVQQAWIGAITAHPLSYLRHRALVSRHLFGSQKSELEGLFFVPAVVPYRDNPPPEPALSGWRDPWASWLRHSRGWMVFAPATYLVLATLALAWGLHHRREDAGRIALALAGSGVLLVAPLTLFAPSAEMRYCGWLYASSVLAAGAVAATRGAGAFARRAATPR
jgi:hypothetical protein